MENKETIKERENECFRFILPQRWSIYQHIKEPCWVDDSLIVPPAAAAYQVFFSQRERGADQYASSTACGAVSLTLFLFRVQPFKFSLISNDTDELCSQKVHLEKLPFPLFYFFNIFGSTILYTQMLSSRNVGRVNLS